uniref:Polygalacturonase n=1 Tax=Lotus japonicus TaxID=34305 RepID=I3T934_LOTJA|nr:unknown [Lotus japonicus]
MAKHLTPRPFNLQSAISATMQMMAGLCWWCHQGNGPQEALISLAISHFFSKKRLSFLDLRLNQSGPHFLFFHHMAEEGMHLLEGSVVSFLEQTSLMLLLLVTMVLLMGKDLTGGTSSTKGQFTLTRPYMIEIMYSNQIQISNLTLVNSPSWFVHPIYSSDIIIQGLTILAPVDSPNTDGIDPDSCSNTRIEDCYIVSGDDCIAVKSGWDEYGIKVGMPSQHIIIRRLTCISPDSAMIALGSEMSGGIQDIRAEDLTAINTQSAVRIKTAVGRGAYVRNIFVEGMNLFTMKYVFWMTGSYGSHPDTGFDPKALPTITGINYRDVIAKNVAYPAKLEGIANDPFTGICISNANIEKVGKKLAWNCTDVHGVTSNVSPEPCALLQEKLGEI